MTALALSLALVAVALVARDVAIRALADRARERGRERADVKRVDLLEARMNGRLDAVATWEGTAETRLQKLEEAVEALKARDQMAALARKGPR